MNNYLNAQIDTIFNYNTEITEYGAFCFYDYNPSENKNEEKYKDLVEQRFIMRLIPAKIIEFDSIISPNNWSEEQLKAKEIEIQIAPEYHFFNRYEYYDNCMGDHPSYCFYKVIVPSKSISLSIDSLLIRDDTLKIKKLIKNGTIEREIVEKAPKVLTQNENYFHINWFENSFTYLACCYKQVNTNTIELIEKALKDKMACEITHDQKLDAKEKACLSQFQKENYLEIGSLNLETLRALGVQY